MDKANIGIKNELVVTDKRNGRHRMNTRVFILQTVVLCLFTIFSGETATRFSGPGLLIAARIGAFTSSLGAFIRTRPLLFEAQFAHRTSAFSFLTIRSHYIYHKENIVAKRVRPNVSIHSIARESSPDRTPVCIVLGYTKPLEGATYPL